MSPETHLRAGPKTGGPSDDLTGSADKDEGGYAGDRASGFLSQLRGYADRSAVKRSRVTDNCQRRDSI
jgi:hypothetical protein